MKTLAWKLNRLQAMGTVEICHRTMQWLGQSWERLKLARGWSPEPRTSVHPARSLLPAVDGWLAWWTAHYRLDRESLHSLIEGKIPFFGHGTLDAGNPVDWHRDPLTGVRAPLCYGKTINYRDPRLVGDIKVLWELGRHQHLVPLAAAYACTGDTEYRAVIADQIDTWMRANPYGRGVHWCSALEAALRLISWSFCHSLLALRDGNDGLFGCSPDRERLGTSIYQHAAFIRGYLSRHSSANNHLIGELTGLWVATQVFDLGVDGRRWANLAHTALEREAGRQVWQDGVDKEQAFYYHLWVLEYLTLAWLAGLRSGHEFSKQFRDRIVHMAGFVDSISPPGGRPPQVGDADDGLSVRFEIGANEDPYYETRAAVAELFHTPTLAEPARAFPQKAFWITLCAGQLPRSVARCAPAPVAQFPVAFPQGGYALLGADGIRVLFDAGPLGYPSIAAHGHADALSFCLAVGSEWWLVDPGTYAYHDEAVWRNYFRGTSAHNTITVDGQNQSRIGGPFLWIEHASARLEGWGLTAHTQWAEGTHDGYRGLGIRHRRRLEFSSERNLLQVVDHLEGTGHHEFRICFHFAPFVSVRNLAQPAQWTAERPDSGLQLSIEGDSRWTWNTIRGRETPPLGWYAPALGHKEPATTLEGAWSGPAPVSVRTVLQVRPA